MLRGSTILMEIDRREFLTGSCATMLTSVPFISTGQTEEIAWYASGRRDARNRHQVVIFGALGNEIHSVQLPGRGHATAVRPGTTQCITFARRPGNFAIAFDARGGGQTFLLSTPPNRHFFGHGIYSRDGRLLFSTENDFENVRGILSVRDVSQNYRRIGEFDTGGIGPHEVAVLPDKRTLVVANGGIETHPDFPGQPLNIAAMSPSLTYLDSENGDILETVKLENRYHQLSIRHLDVAGDGAVIFGCQHMGPKSEHPPLIGFHKRGRSPEFAEAPEIIFPAMRNYVGSVAINQRDQVVAATSSPGNLAAFFDIQKRKFIGSCFLEDVGGIAGHRNKSGFIATTGSGQVHDVQRIMGSLNSQLIVDQSSANWDNHVTAISF